MKKLSLPELQQYLLTSLIAFDSYCQSHHIKYSLCGGTLIGAVRHHGFIPWDDDTDVMMTRSEYQKLTATWKTNPLEGYILLTNDSAQPAYAGESGKWFATSTAPLHPKNDYDIGLFLDIFIADGLPEDDSLKRKHFSQMHDAGHRYHSIYKRRHHPLMKLFCFLYPPFRPSHIRNQIQKKQNLYPDTTATDLALILGSGSDMHRETIPKNYFENFTVLSFEGHDFPVISEYDAYLRHYYGDYMKLPPEEERLSYHTRNHVLKSE